MVYAINSGAFFAGRPTSTKLSLCVRDAKMFCYHFSKSNWIIKVFYCSCFSHILWATYRIQSGSPIHSDPFMKDSVMGVICKEFFSKFIIN